MLTLDQLPASRDSAKRSAAEKLAGDYFSHRLVLDDELSHHDAPFHGQLDFQLTQVSGFNWMRTSVHSSWTMVLHCLDKREQILPVRKV